MNLRPTSYTAPVLIVAVLCGVIAAHSLRRRGLLGDKSLAVLMLSVMVWSLAHTLQASAAQATLALIWAQVELAGMLAAPLAWLVFTLEFTHNQKWLAPRKLKYLSIAPATLFLVACLRASSFFDRVQIRTLHAGPLTLTTLQRGWFFWLQAGYSLLIFSCALGLLLWKYHHTSPLGRRRTAITMGIAILPWTASLLYILDLNPAPYPDWRPLVLGLTGGLVAWGSLHYRVLNIAPIARNTIFDSMSDGACVIDSQGRVADANRAAIETIGLPASQIIGQPIEEVYSRWSALAYPDEATLAEGILGLEETHQVIKTASEGKETFYELCINSLYDQPDQPCGWLAVWRDVTQHKQVEQALRASEESHRQSVENSPNPIFSVTSAGKIHSWNQACEDIFQHGQEIIGHDYRAILLDDDTAGALDAMLERVFKDKESFNNIDLGYRCKDGDRRYMVSRLYPLLDRQGGVRYCIFANTDITERKLNDKALRRQFEELSVLHRVARACAEAAREEELIERITEIIGQTYYPDNFGFLSLDQTHGHLEFHPSYKGIPEDLKKTRIPLGEGLTGRVAQSGELVRASDVLQEPSYIHLHHQTRSELCVPLKIGESVIGVINTEHREPQAYSENDERLLLTLAGQISTAIHRLRSERSQRRQARQLAAIYQASQDIATNLGLEQVYLATHQAVSQLMPSEAFVITVLDQEKEQIIPLYFVDRRGRSSPPPIPADRGLSGHVIRTGKPVLIDDVKKGTEIDVVQAGDPNIVRSILAVPMQYRGKVFGMLSAQSYQPGVYTLENQQTLSTLANQVAIALENARLFEEIHRRAAQQEALNRIIAATATARGVSELLETVLAYALNALDLDSGEVCVKGHQAALGLLRGSQRTAHKGAIREHSETLAVEDWRRSESEKGRPEFAEKMRALGLRASLTVPVLSESQHIGEMTLACETPHAWLSEEAALIEAVGRQLGSAVERLNLLGKTRDQARQMQQIMDSVPDGVLLLGSQQEVILTNPAARRYLTQLSPPSAHRATIDEAKIQRLGGQPIQDILHSQQALSELKIQEPVYKIFEIAAQPLQSQGGDEGWVLVLRDVTQERENRNRIQMQERLATVGQLAAGIAHDFNNIMAAIVVYADLLMLEGNISPPNQERLKIIQRQVQRASSLIRQILDFSRRSVMEQSDLDLLPFIKELHKLLGRVLPEIIRLELRTGPGPYLVKGDPTRLQQALMNLSLNARDAISSGGLLRFELARYHLTPQGNPPLPDLSPGDWVVIRVIDDGHGIPPEVMPHIFEPFFTTKPVGQGTGLGLAQVYGIIKQHGGSIKVDSQPGNGASFTIYLPAMKTAQAGPSPEPPAWDARGEGETILLVEDDRAARDAMRDLLLNQNYRVQVAANGVEALTLLNKSGMHVPLVITDIVMPEMGGLELYRYLKVKYPRTQVLFVTGHPLNGRSKTLLEGGKVRWLQKPFSVQQFSDLVHSMLNGKESSKTP